MDTFIEIFNANRHWILPVMLAGVVSVLVRELKIFFLPLLPERASEETKSASIYADGQATRLGFSFGFFLRRPRFKKKSKLQLGSAVLFHETRFNSMK